MKFCKELTEGNKQFRDFILAIIQKQLGTKEIDLLELGCGNGRFATLLAPHIKSYTGIDPNTESIQEAKNTTPKNAQTKYYIGTAEETTLNKNKTFDVILFAYSWHFIKDYKKAIQQLQQHLNKNGRIIIIEPTETTNTWADPVLRKGTKEYNEKAHKEKIKKLQQAKKEIETLTKSGFTLITKFIDRKEKPNIWTLKKA